LNCSKKRNDIIKVAAFAFHRFVDIHPFFNGSARVGTILLNSFLAAFDLNTIALRSFDEVNDETSLYTKATRHIGMDDDTSDMEKHISLKLDEIDHHYEAMLTQSSKELVLQKKILN